MRPGMKYLIQCHTFIWWLYLPYVSWHEVPDIVSYLYLVALSVICVPGHEVPDTVSYLQAYATAYEFK